MIAAALPAADQVTEAGDKTAAADQPAETGGTPAPMDLSVLILGMGSGTYYHQCDRFFRGLAMEGVEIDEKITRLAHEYFDLPEDAQVRTYDGRAYLAAVDDKYDVIMVDAYQDITIPFQMSSVEFFKSTRDHLTDNGVLVVNMNIRSDAEDGINTRISDTIASVYPHVSTIDVPGNTNRVLFASAREPGTVAFAKATEALSTTDPARKARIESFLGTIPDGLRSYKSKGYLLTDDQAPVELLGMRAIDELISDELVVYKETFREEGIKGLLSFR